MDELGTVQAIAIALLGGAGGALVTTLLRIRHEREERFRDRLVEAADDYATGMVQAIIGLKDVTSAIENERSADDVEAARERAEDLIDEAHARIARIDLLFGDESPAAVAAGETVTKLRVALRATGTAPPDKPAYQFGMFEAHESNIAFGRHARAVIRGQRWRDRLRRQ